jgi:sulfite reductase (ferredoxin)
MIEKKSKLERIKEASQYLRGPIGREMFGPESHVEEASKQLLKFHGMYQQDDRDQRAERRAKKQDKAWSFMIRSRIPGGRLTAAQYLAHDDLATRHANGTLRITTRQGLQLHGVLKGNVRPTIREINTALVTTLGACGDVVRNVMCCPLPSADPARREVQALVREISDRMTPRTGAYHELWLDGEKVFSGWQQATTNEPIYGEAYLPRKFKIAVAYPGDNCTDVFTQDLGLVAFIEDGKLTGFNVLVGGGLGMTHNKPGTFPRLADPMAFVAPSKLVDVVEQIVCVQRDHGDRNDRRHARLKYLIHDRGLDWFRRRVERRLRCRLSAPLKMPSFAPRLHLGWKRQPDSQWSLGVSVENGRIGDRDDRRLKTALRTVVEQFQPGVRLTPAQDVLLTGFRADAVAPVESVLHAHGIATASQLSKARAHSMACPALPTCGLALAEAERALPGVIDELELVLDALGLGSETISVRMTGCPNGCARPYVADIGFVGRSVDRYVVLVGGRADGTRLNQIYADLIPREELVETVRPLLQFFRDARRNGESFGDFCVRVGIAALRAYAQIRGATVAHG